MLHVTAAAADVNADSALETITIIEWLLRIKAAQCTMHR